MDKQSTRKEILKKVIDYYHAAFDADRETFRPESDKVNYAGRVFDEDELVNLVDSSLDFWRNYQNSVRSAYFMSVLWT